MAFHNRKASISGSGAPTAVTPEFIGQVYVNTAGPDFYYSNGLDEGDWAIMGEADVHALNGVMHDGVSGTVEDNFLSLSATGYPKDSGVGESDLQLKSQDWVPKVFAQDGEPTLTGTLTLAFWKDTNDSDRIYLLTKRGTSDQVAVELT